MTHSEEPSFSFVTWYPSCRRSDGIARALRGPSHLIHFLGFKNPLQAPVKYLAQAVKTIQVLRADRPDYVIVACPPVVAAIIVFGYCKLSGSGMIVDAHTGVFDDPRWKWAHPIHRWLAKRSIATIVTSSALGDVASEWGSAVVVLGTVPIEFAPSAPADLGGQNVMAITTFSNDEPIEEVLDAARSLPSVTFHLTGQPTDAHKDLLQTAPKNVRLTGWMTDEEYHSLLQSTDCAVCLTTRDHTMQRGGYEAMALGVPLITSDWTLLKETFNRGTVHIDNSAMQLAKACELVLSKRSELSDEMAELRVERNVQFAAAIETLRTLTV